MSFCGEFSKSSSWEAGVLVRDAGGEEVVKSTRTQVNL
jgi:hypothetical protein